MNTQNQTSRRTRVLKIALAGIAVAGIGAALTTAAWTDDVLFSADATASSFDLQGAANPSGGPCDDSLTYGDEGLSTPDVAIDITTEGELGALAPGEVYEVPFCLYNDGSLAGTLTGPETITVEGTLVEGNYLSADDLEVTLDATTIAAGGYVGGTLTVTTPAEWDDDAFEDEAHISFTVTGESTTTP
ncbi:hypothetical protein [Agromyces larvae]|uniref:SipW-cognate class signal peptide n=1 Tax=Agromyces larvae TaxID=2929802 RepID=A0ABY4BX94_9MICO|nr:hypothetical protein [Agromyces larvae]UOE43815.1 hypothetical protein MTO99_16850 [Agromyces larvae]